MKKTNLIIIGVFLLVIPLVFAAPPVTIIEENTNGLQIEHPLALRIKQNSNYTFIIHTFNISNGIETDGISTDCVIHLYDNAGRTINNSNMTLVTIDTNYRYEINFTSNHFDRIGLYEFLVYCNNGMDGGFIKEVFEVTKDGFGIEPNIGLYISLTLIFIFLVSVGLIFYFWRGEGKDD